MRSFAAGFYTGLAILATTSVAQAYTFELLVDEAEILAVTAAADADPGELAVNSAGMIALVDQQTNNKILFITPGTPNTVVLAVTQQNMIDAINAANGTTPDVATVTIQSVRFNADGRLVVYADGGGAELATLMTVEPTAPYTINVLSCAVDGGSSPIEGGNGMIVIGNNAYLIVDSSFGATEDAILRVNTSPVVNDGSAAVSTVIGEAALLAATGQDTAANQRIADGWGFGADGLLLINSGLANSNDNLILVDNLSTTPAASLYASAVDVEAGLALLDPLTTDIGPNAMTVNGDGHPVLINAFGNTGSLFDEGLIVISATGPVNVSTSITQDEIIAGIGATVGTNNLVVQGDGAGWDSANNRLLFSTGTASDANTTAIEGVIAVIPASSVREWMIHD